jgi:hypothetical protein
MVFWFLYFYLFHVKVAMKFGVVLRPACSVTAVPFMFIAVCVPRLRLLFCGGVNITIQLFSCLHDVYVLNKVISAALESNVRLMF